MRSIVIVIVIVLAACGSKAPEPQPGSAASATAPVPTARTADAAAPAPPPPRLEPIVVASFHGDELATYSITPTAVSRISKVSLPEQIEDAQWLDRDRIAVVGDSGRAYRVTAAKIERYKMPAAKAWRLHAPTGARRSTFPHRVALVSEADGVSIVSCVAYEMGDDDPCVAWAAAALKPTLAVGKPAASSGPPDRDSERGADIAAPAGVTVTAETHAAVVDVACTAAGKTAHRTWDTSGACGAIGASVTWLETRPPIVAIRITTSCGEGPDQTADHILRTCALTDFVDGDPESQTIAWADGLWAYSTAQSGWTVLAGEHEVGTIAGALRTRP